MIIPKNYDSGEVDILGDGTGARVYIEVNDSGEIIDTTVTSGGKNYTYAIVDLGPLQPPGSSLQNPAKLIPIIPPSRGHGYDLYRELGADRVFVYSRFDDSTRDFSTNTKFCQIGILKNPSNYTSSGIYTGSDFSGTYSIKFSSVNSFSPQIGEKIIQSVSSGVAVGYVASYDSDTKVLKYFKDRSLYYSSTRDQTDYVGVSTYANANVKFDYLSSNNVIGETSGFSGTIDATFSGISTAINNKLINLGVSFTYGLANPEINKKTGDIIYVDNRPLITRNSRQKEDIKIILEF